MTTHTKFEDKFVAFIDVMGFKSMVKNAESGSAPSLDELRGMLTLLGSDQHVQRIRADGPYMCPDSPRVARDLQFQVTQISDCAIVSAEISPAGAIAVISHCWTTAISLLTRGVLVRGYVNRGKVFHREREVIGSGYQEAYEREARVSAFKREADETGTPFIEIAPSVCEYIAQSGDSCVRKVFGRQVRNDGTVTAVFPFQVLSHSFVIGGIGEKRFDAEREKRSNDVIRNNLLKMKVGVLRYVDESNERAMRKVRHYVAALDEQLAICDETDDAIDHLVKPIGGASRRT